MCYNESMNTLPLQSPDIIVSEYTNHEQVYLDLVNDFIDTNIEYVIKFLYMSGVTTLHSCEGNPKDTSQGLKSKRGYIHFYNAAHLQRAVILLHNIALANNNVKLADYIMQENTFKIKKNGDITSVRKNWDYEIAWTTAHPGDKRDNPYRGYSLTAVLRIPHAHICLLNSYLAAPYGVLAQ